VTACQQALSQVRRNPPPDWGRLFAYVPGRSSKVRCLLCGRSGHGTCGPTATFSGGVLTPAPWQAVCLLGHAVQCEICRRPFIGPGALRAHQTCKLHHACCAHHTTVPEWKNPFAHAVTVTP
jgi:hypothetical protein